MKKHLPSIISGIIIALGFGALSAHAQGYVPLAPLPGTVDATTGQTTMPAYISGMIKLIIAAGGALAILMAIIGGTQYVAAGISPDAKNTAKDNITNAFIGLALILSSYLILNSIDPKLVEFNLTLEKVTPPPLVVLQDTSAAGISPGGAMGAGESQIRNVLETGGVLINNEGRTCPEGVSYQQFRESSGSGCTTMEGIPWRVLGALTSLKRNCNCTVIVTGGAEAGHQTHGVGIGNVDLASDSALNTYITTTGTATTNQSCGVALDPHYTLAGGTYVFENGDHWHVCY